MIMADFDMKKVEKALAALARHEFETKYFATGAEAAAWLDAQVPEGATVGQGGSVTLDELGLIQRFKERGLAVPNPWDGTLSDEQRRLAYRDALFADNFFCSANAITLDGFILNVDGRGNRLAAHLFGPRRLFIVAGVNKLVEDEAAAFERVKYAAPRNCRRLSLKTPCVVTGACSNCDTPARSCRAYLLLRRPTRAVPTTVVLIGEELGF